MNNKKYSAIVFDLGNVLIPFDYNKTIQNVNMIEPGLGSRFIEFYKSNYYIHKDFERGKISEDEFLNIMLKVIDNKITKEEFRKYYSDIFSLNENVINLLPELKKKYKLYVLSNTDPIHQKYGWQKFGFLKQFDGLILSHDAGAVKPEEEIYRRVERVSGFSGSELFYIDDIEEYVLAARSFGWNAVQFTDYNSLINDFKAGGILNNETD